MSDVARLAEEHTPGPWRVDPTHSLCIESAAHGNIGLVNIARSSEADARLIAAAPELLQALHKLLEWQAEVKHAVPLIYLEKARAAISKATER